MSNDLNQCNFIGRLGKDPDVRYTQSGTAVANFRIAVGETYKTASGERKENTEWVSCVAWKRLAEIVGEYLHKGDQIFVSGKMATRSYDKNGVTMYATEVIVNQLQMLGSPKSGGKPHQKPGENVPEKEYEDDLNDDIPF